MPAPPEPVRPTENKILAALDDSQAQRLFAQLERVSLMQGEVIYEADARIEHVYFPETAVFSMLSTMENGDTVEVGPVGREGLLGLRVFLGAEKTLYRAIVHVAGSALRLSASALKAELCDGRTAMTEKLIRYTQMLLAMTGRSCACNKLHSLEQQLARWLLTMSDYVGDEISLTHELMALTLGVRRAGVSEAANNFRTQGIIAYHRGRIQLLDREGLEAIACECYRMIKNEYDSLYADLAKSAG
ncbi:MAG TPA: Crp/Fnr family transcriptional regulator [Pyrinomonadaceae bacterium]|nr:Crp/Fnr family transcriptional regulator [Pyrinomonadaceae bacterium]